MVMLTNKRAEKIQELLLELELIYKRRTVEITYQEMQGRIEEIKDSIKALGVEE